MTKKNSVVTEDVFEVATLNDSLPYPADGLFRYKVDLYEPRTGNQVSREFATRWSPSKVDNVEVGVACAAQINALGKERVEAITAERVA